MGFGASEKSLAKFAANQREYLGKERDALRAAALERIGEGVYALNEKTLRQEQVRATQLRHQNSSNQTNQHAGKHSAINGLIAPARVKRRDPRNTLGFSTATVEEFEIPVPDCGLSGIIMVSATKTAEPCC